VKPNELLKFSWWYY